jgi:hypothetical protein
LIVGAAAGGLCCLCLVIGIIVFIALKSRGSKRSNNANEGNNVPLQSKLID